ncbi:phospho-N-acetylmuramoyl-pentapeptide-transferase [Thermodesulfatator indicus DSM 15286]|uniref:Phospho-N-acetylmuramoyl-pentapeptide-transferase n=1 Tax=Thermodesulfatator indicus (strain DSM 15286 / JCM 11887 / CIR29812) TaxID=667014 RepID=F8AAP5_THEID|nr:phospho-N-acetylmuramoyl-pentapeptide-transferase [Thermodesulfatator indicus]AEH44318.1 phospho-N-acetylmuramoyl-pentapeptide-transferase [Thermodesulfatator indicus DSM 15286]
MLYHLLYSLHEWHFIFNVFRYITFRTICAIFTSALIVFILMPRFIAYMRARQFGQVIREIGPDHQHKAGTPTMGGVVIILAVIIATLLWGKLTNIYIWITLGLFLIFGLIGFFDDWRKVSRQKSLGLTAKEKLLLQSLTAGVFLFLALKYGSFDTKLAVPFFKEFRPDLGFLYFPFVMIVVVGASNAFNLTDGLDGLATGPFIVTTGVYLLFVYLAGHFKLASYLHVPYVPGAGELCIFCGALLGAALAFLWYNSYPAEIFMGDVGSLSLGASLGALAIISKQELLLVIAGGVFVAEALSVMLQVVYFRLTGGKRIFRMAPLHHHFEKLGWPEPKVIVRFWIAAIFLGLLAVSTLKLR